MCFDVSDPNLIYPGYTHPHTLVHPKYPLTDTTLHIQRTKHKHTKIHKSSMHATKATSISLLYIRTRRHTHAHTELHSLQQAYTSSGTPHHFIQPVYNLTQPHTSDERIPL